MPASQLKPFFPRKEEVWVITLCSITGRTEFGAENWNFSTKIWPSDDGERDLG